MRSRVSKNQGGMNCFNACRKGVAFFFRPTEWWLLEGRALFRDEQMAYNKTTVAVSKSQGAIRKLVLNNNGEAVAFFSQPPREGFEALILIDDKTYQIRIVAMCREEKTEKLKEQEERRVWRVLYYHLKAVYEAAGTGVLEFRELILPYIVVRGGKTIAQTILPNLDKALLGKTRLLGPAPSSEGD